MLEEKEETKYIDYLMGEEDVESNKETVIHIFLISIKSSILIG